MTRITLVVIAACIGIVSLGGIVRAQTDRATVVVNPNANGQGTARTIQEGIDMVAEGGKVLVRPGTYQATIGDQNRVLLASVRVPKMPSSWNRVERRRYSCRFLRHRLQEPRRPGVEMLRGPHREAVP